MTKRKKWGVALVILPGASLILVLFLQLFVRFALTKTSSDNPCTDAAMVQRLEEMPTADCADLTSSSSSPAKSLINVVSILLGMFSALGFLPCIIIGIVLLATDGKNGAVTAQAQGAYPPVPNNQPYAAPNPVVQSSGQPSEDSRSRFTRQ